MPRSPILLLGAYILALAACRDPNPNHCAWQADPGASCLQKSGGALPLCSRCTADNDGCVASDAAVDDACLVGGSADGTESGTQTSDGSETTGTNGTETDATDTLESSTDTSTTDTTDTTDSTETGGPDCGNGEIDPGEACDGDNLNGKTCMDLGRPPGELLCDDFCNFDFDGCCKPNGTVCEADDECCTGKCDMLVTNKCTNL